MPYPLTPSQEAMLAFLRDAARRGKECPSDAALERRLGMSKPSDVLVALHRKGHIEIDRIGYKRIIRFTDTGESTAMPDGAAVSGVGVVYRSDACWYCGTRPDADDQFKCRRCR